MVGFRDFRGHLPRTFLLEGFYFLATPPATRALYGSALVRCDGPGEAAQIHRLRHGTSDEGLGRCTFVTSKSPSALLQRI